MLSVIIITLNEEQKIRDCLESVSWADEIIVVDGLSNDKTVEIAREYTKKVYERQFTGFGDQKSYALSKATSRWVLSIDADERVTPELREEISKTLPDSQASGYEISIKTYFSGKWIKHCGWYPGYHLRLFRRDKGKFSDRLVHEAIELAGPVEKLKNHIDHYSYSSVADLLRKADHYSTLGAKVLLTDKRRYFTFDAFTHGIFAFIKTYFIKFGFLDRWRGLAIANANANGAFYKYIKYIELREKSKAELSVAVILSTYNSPEYLAKVLDGYLAQSLAPDELIVADDGSDSRTAKVVSEFASKAEFPIRHIWHEDNGFRLAQIRNKAVNASSASYLIFTDGDCIPHPCFIKDHLRVIKAGYFVLGKRMLVSKQASVSFTYPGFWKLLAMCLKGDISGGHHLLRIPAVAIANKGIDGIRGCNFALYRKDFLTVNGFNEDFVGWGREDSELAVRLYKYGLKRRDIRFSALMFHLWHKLGSNEFLSKNDALLDEAVKSSGFYCENGIDKHFRNYVNAPLIDVINNVERKEEIIH